MTEPWTPQLILKGVTAVLVDAMGIDEEEVSIEKSLVHDLGAQSIDFLDFVFRLEKTFELSIGRTEGFPEIDEDDLHKPITHRIFEHVQTNMPFIEIETYIDPKKATLGNMYTVEYLCRLVAHKLKVQWVAPQATPA